MVSEPFICPPPPVVAGEPILTTVTGLLRLKKEPFSGPMAPENQSSELLDVLEQRLETQITLVGSNQQRLEQNTSDIRDLKQAMSRIEACLQDLSVTIDGLAQQGQINHADCSFSSFGCTENIRFGTYSNTSSRDLKSQNKNTLPLIPPFTISHNSEARIDEAFKMPKQEERDSDAKELKIQRFKNHKLEESMNSLTMETDIGDEEAMCAVLDNNSASIASTKGSQSLRTTTSVVVSIESRQMEPLLSHEGDDLKHDKQKIQSYPFSSSSCSMLSKATMMPQKLIFDLTSLESQILRVHLFISVSMVAAPSPSFVAMKTEEIYPSFFGFRCRHRPFKPELPLSPSLYGCSLIVFLPYSTPVSKTEYMENPPLPSALVDLKLLNTNIATNFFCSDRSSAGEELQVSGQIFFNGDFIWHRWKLRSAVLVTWNEQNVIVQGPKSELTGCYCRKFYFPPLFLSSQAPIMVRLLFYFDTMNSKESSKQISSGL